MTRGRFVEGGDFALVDVEGGRGPVEESESLSLSSCSGLLFRFCSSGGS